MNNQERIGSSSPQDIKLQTDQSAIDSTAGSPPNLSSSPSDRRASTDEWDASKVPPSRFQKRKGSIYATPGSRDGHVDRNYASGFHEKHTEKGYGKSDKQHHESKH